MAFEDPYSRGLNVEATVTLEQSDLVTLHDMMPPRFLEEDPAITATRNNLSVAKDGVARMVRSIAAESSRLRDLIDLDQPLVMVQLSMKGLRLATGELAFRDALQRAQKLDPPTADAPRVPLVLEPEHRALTGVVATLHELLTVGLPQAGVRISLDES